MAEPSQPPVDDEPVRRYLRALTESGPRPADEVSAGARYKRYLDTDRYALPWARALPAGTADTVTPAGSGGAELLGALLVDLLGIVRLIWSLPIEATGRVSPGPPRLLLGRPAPSGGALHPIEAYLACRGGVGPPAGLYHYDPVHHALARVRADDHRAALVGTLAAPPDAVPDVVLVLTAVFTRTMARYGDFGYRLQCQETGILLAQALALAQRLGLPASAYLRFTGTDADRLLGLDGSREGVLAMLGLTLPGPELAEPADPVPPPATELAGRPAAAEARPPDPMPAALPAAVLHRAGRNGVIRAGGNGVIRAGGNGVIRAGGPVPADRAAPEHAEPHLPVSPAEPRLPVSPAAPCPLPVVPSVRLADGVPHRASPFAGYPPVTITTGQLAAILAAASAGYPGDLPDTDAGPATVDLCAVVLRVDGVPRGGYRYDRRRHRLLPLGGEPTVAAIVGGPLLPNTRLALRGAAAVLIPVGDPLSPVRRFGPDWYRLQQTEVGLVVHRATLAAAALGLASRIHSEGTNGGTDAALGLDPTRRQSLGFLAVGARARKLTRRVPDLPALRRPQGGGHVALTAAPPPMASDQPSRTER